jgi:exopolyphosphatase/guanosine-5'-triphosphate,3'-diphosphate pyrophosphatase
VSMRDGLLLDLPSYVTGEQDPALRASIIQSARTIGERYSYEEEHAEQVAELAVRLFDALQDGHGLQPRHRLLLQVAALLHEVGVFVSNRAHHKHSYYLIANAEILGLRREDIGIVAHVARYHRRSMPKTSHLDYMALPPQQRMVVNKLAAILRVADCLDRGHMGRVKDPEIEVQGRELVIYVPGAGDLSLERLALGEKADLMEDIFGLNVRLEEGRPRGEETGPRPPA